uniref:Ceramide-1-phosphate transfer protein n=2 Tax=Leptobrachium leishanense TaxID=445787 RepID=A0A8C5Q8A8_9ANUR
MCAKPFFFCLLRSSNNILCNRFKMDSAEDKFCLREVLVSFKSCLLNDDKDVLVEHYLTGWKGLVRFMNTLGTVFSFVSKDAVTKIQIMENYLKGDNGERYRTLRSMVEYELSGNLVDLTKRSSHPDSGCRTLLRLHRALRWLQLFLEKLRTSSEDSKTSTLCSEAYNDSLANYHPWLIRKTASVAFFALPTRNTFFEVMNVGSPDVVVEMLGEALPYVSKVYDFTQELYVQRNLLDLP